MSRHWNNEFVSWQGKCAALCGGRPGLVGKGGWSEPSLPFHMQRSLWEAGRAVYTGVLKSLCISIGFSATL